MCRSFFVFELYSTHCSHHGSLCPSSNSHLTFLLAPYFTSMQYCWPYISLMNSSFHLWRKPPAIQQLTTLPKINPPISCSGSHICLKFATNTHPVTKVCKFIYNFLFITTFLPAALPLQYSSHIFFI